MREDKRQDARSERNARELSHHHQRFAKRRGDAGQHPWCWQTIAEASQALRMQWVEVGPTDFPPRLLR